MANLDRSVAPFCTLGPEALSERIAWIRSEILPHAHQSEALAQGRAWEFSSTAPLRAKLERLITLERQCCSHEGITFHLEDHAARGVLRLEVRGLDPHAKIFSSLGEVTGGGGLLKQRI